MSPAIHKKEGGYKERAIKAMGNYHFHDFLSHYSFQKNQIQRRISLIRSLKIVIEAYQFLKR